MQISTDYNLTWRLKFAPHYQFTDSGICVNVQRGKVVKKTVVGLTKGYCILGKFKSCKQLRPYLEFIPKKIYPF